MRKLPPLASLRAFEAAARHLSFKWAAAELGVTPTAISHQVRLLEDDLRTVPVSAASPAAGADERRRAVVSGPAEWPRSFATAVALASDDAEQRPLRVTTPNAFASRWLVPRLPEWREGHPEIPLEVIGTDAVLDLRADEADVAIRYARSMPTEFVAQELFRDIFLSGVQPGVVDRKALPSDVLPICCSIL